jgi:hypothetical protein
VNKIKLKQIEAKNEKCISRELTKAAIKMENTKFAMNLRYIQALFSITRKGKTTIIYPMPI